MSIFNKKNKPKLSHSFPFMEDNGGEITLKYDSLKLSMDDGRATLTFIREDVPMYAHTFEFGDQHIYRLNDMHGDIKIKIKLTKV